MIVSTAVLVKLNARSRRFLRVIRYQNIMDSCLRSICLEKMILYQLCIFTSTRLNAIIVKVIFQRQGVSKYVRFRVV